MRKEIKQKVRTEAIKKQGYEDKNNYYLYVVGLSQYGGTIAKKD